MIFTLILIGLVVAGIVCAIIGDRLSYKFEWVFVTGMITLVASSIISIVVIASIITVNVVADTDYQNKLYERDMLEYRIKHMEKNITGNEMLYNDIVEFNNELRTVKKWANNPWTNWFNNQKIATIDYIELENK